MSASGDFGWKQSIPVQTDQFQLSLDFALRAVERLGDFGGRVSNQTQDGEFPQFGRQAIEQLGDCQIHVVRRLTPRQFVKRPFGSHLTFADNATGAAPFGPFVSHETTGFERRELSQQLPKVVAMHDLQKFPRADSFPETDEGVLHRIVDPGGPGRMMSQDVAGQPLQARKEPVPKLSQCGVIAVTKAGEVPRH
jgi:hypothetical protein